MKCKVTTTIIIAYYSSLVLFEISFVFLAFISLGLFLFEKVHCSIGMGLYLDYIDRSQNVVMGKVWRLIALRRRLGCEILIGSAQQILAKALKGMERVTSADTLLKVMAMLEMS